jgi:hypothetical protein
MCLVDVLAHSPILIHKTRLDIAVYAGMRPIRYMFYPSMLQRTNNPHAECNRSRCGSGAPNDDAAIDRVRLSVSSARHASGPEVLPWLQLKGGRGRLSDLLHLLSLRKGLLRGERLGQSFDGAATRCASMRNGDSSCRDCQGQFCFFLKPERGSGLGS